jgi:hypothetical protein
MVGLTERRCGRDQIGKLTIFFSEIGLQFVSLKEIERLVQDERLVGFRNNENLYCRSVKYSDDAGNRMWSVNVVVGDEESTFLSESMPIYPYSRCGEPDTMFYPVPITAAWESWGGREVWITSVTRTLEQIYAMHATKPRTGHPCVLAYGNAVRAVPDAAQPIQLAPVRGFVFEFRLLSCEYADI